MKKKLNNQEMNAEDCAFLLVAQVCRTDVTTLLRVFNTLDYTPRKKKKRSGGYRQYFVPHPDLGAIQKKLLQHFFTQLDRRKIYSTEKNYYGTPRLVQHPYFADNLHGFLKRKSYVDNAKKHTQHFTRFVLRLDLKDAFPSITREMVETVLRDIIKKDIEKYWDSWNSRLQDHKSFAIISKISDQVGPRPFRLQDIQHLIDWEERVNDLLAIHDPENVLVKFQGNIPTGIRRSILRNYGKVYERYPLFPARRCKEFREEIRKGAKNKEISSTLEQVITSFISIVLELVTHQNTLVQGAATSGFLFMLVMQHKNLLGGIDELLCNKYNLHRTLSMYADDITIGFEERPTQEMIQSLVDHIESHGFKVNHKKTKVWDRRQIAPVITGVRLVRKEYTGDAIDSFIASRTSKKNNYSGATQRKREGGIWYKDTVSIPKKLQRKIRAVFYQGATDEHVPEKLHNLIAGYKGMVIQVYGRMWSDIPNGILSPLKLYLERFNPTSFTT